MWPYTRCGRWRRRRVGAHGETKRSAIPRVPKGSGEKSSAGDHRFKIWQERRHDAGRTGLAESRAQVTAGNKRTTTSVLDSWKAVEQRTGRWAGGCPMSGQACSTPSPRGIRSTWPGTWRQCAGRPSRKLSAQCWPVAARSVGWARRGAMRSANCPAWRAINFAGT